MQYNTVCSMEYAISSNKLRLSNTCSHKRNYANIIKEQHQHDQIFNQTNQIIKIVETPASYIRCVQIQVAGRPSAAAPPLMLFCIVCMLHALSLCWLCTWLLLLCFLWFLSILNHVDVLFDLFDLLLGIACFVILSIVLVHFRIISS